MTWIGQGVAFAALVASAVVLELYDKPSDGLWVLIVVWAISTQWHPKDKTRKSSERSD
jgi:hypothetical protein